MTKLYYIPIEPLEERYTEQWYRNFPSYFRDSGYSVEIIDGEPLSSSVDVGTFLDEEYDFLKQIAKHFKDI